MTTTSSFCLLNDLWESQATGDWRKKQMMLGLCWNLYLETSLERIWLGFWWEKWWQRLLLTQLSRSRRIRREWAPVYGAARKFTVSSPEPPRDDAVLFPCASGRTGAEQRRRDGNPVSRIGWARVSLRAQQKHPGRLGPRVNKSNNLRESFFPQLDSSTSKPGDSNVNYSTL